MSKHIQPASENSFIHQLYNWSKFEQFVADLYAEDGDVIIERNVVEHDKYGARRETDVKITRKTKFHTYITLVECKRWKEPVSRDRVDVLAASLDGLNAQKGVIFTTTGYEDGAEAYAKGKGIDLFIVRELTDEEWGLPGRLVHLVMNFWTGEFKTMHVQADLIPLIEDFSGSVDLTIALSKDHVADPNFDLYSVKTGERGPNLCSVLIDSHSLLLRQLSNMTQEPYVGGKDIELDFPVLGRFDFNSFDFCQLRLREGALRLKNIEFTFHGRVAQSNIRVDRGDKFDIAIAVEDFLNDKRYYALRDKGEGQLRAESFKVQRSDKIPENTKIVSTMVRVVSAPWVPVSTERAGGAGVIAGKVVIKPMSYINGVTPIELTMEAGGLLDEPQAKHSKETTS